MSPLVRRHELDRAQTRVARLLVAAQVHGGDAEVVERGGLTVKRAELGELLCRATATGVRLLEPPLTGDRRDRGERGPRRLEERVENEIGRTLLRHAAGPLQDALGHVALAEQHQASHAREHALTERHVRIALDGRIGRKPDVGSDLVRPPAHARAEDQHAEAEPPRRRADHQQIERLACDFDLGLPAQRGRVAVEQQEPPSLEAARAQAHAAVREQGRADEVARVDRRLRRAGEQRPSPLGLTCGFGVIGQQPRVLLAAPAPARARQGRARPRDLRA